MRFLKRVLVGVLIFTAAYLPFVVIVQAVSGGDFTSAYAAGGAASVIELILCTLIKRSEKQSR